MLEGYDGESDWNAVRAPVSRACPPAVLVSEVLFSCSCVQVGKDFPKSKVHEKAWKSVKL